MACEVDMMQGFDTKELNTSEITDATSLSVIIGSWEDLR